MNLIEQAVLDATDCYRAGMGLPKLYRDVPQRVYVDRFHDLRDAALMAEWLRARAYAIGFGRSYHRTQFCRAFHGLSPQEIREVGAA